MDEETIAPVGPVLTYDMFARTLQPRTERVPSLTRPGVFHDQIVPGSPDEIYLRLLRIRCGREKHTAADWSAIIDGMRNEPAHPSVLGG